MVAGVLAVFAAGLIASAAYSSDESAESTPTVPRYSETCAHGHNGFDCRGPSHSESIDSLEQRVENLERSVQSLLERR